MAFFVDFRVALVLSLRILVGMKNTTLWTDSRLGSVIRHDNPDIGRPVYFLAGTHGPNLTLFSRFTVGSKTVALDDAQVVDLVRNRHVVAGGFHLVGSKFAIQKGEKNFYLNPCVISRNAEGWRVETATKFCTIAEPKGLLLDMQKKGVAVADFDTPTIAKAFASWERSEDAVHSFDSKELCARFGFDEMGLSATRSGNHFTPQLMVSVSGEWMPLPSFQEGAEKTFSDLAERVPVSQSMKP